MQKILFILFSSLILSACGGGSAAGNETGSLETVPAEFAGKTNPFGSEAVSAGAEVFKSYCVSCHGEYGRGDGVAGASLDPQPKNLAELQAQVTDDYLFWRIHSGKPGTSMVAWNGILTEEQIWQVVAFIRMLK
jgi:mono/diheme cytochrome c family protein